MASTLALTDADTRRLRTALSTILSPLERSSLDEWRGEVCRAVRDFVGAERSIFVMPHPGHAVLHGEGVSLEALDDYMRHFAAQDLGLIRQRELGIEVWSVFELLDKREHRRTEIWNDWKVPNGILGATGITLEVDALPAGIVCYDDAEDLALEERQVKLMGLLRSAFLAGVQAYRRFASEGTRLAAALDGLHEPVALCDARGQLVHTNRRLGAILAREPAEERLLDAVGRVAASLASLRARNSKGSHVALPSLSKVVCRTPFREYRITATYLGNGLLPSGVAILASVQVARQAMPTEEEVSQRLGLTRRQATVALLLAKGLTNEQMAAELSISPHTARHHTENIFLRLNVHSRAQLVTRVMALRSELT